jgi:hypothetical protein
MEKIYEFLRKKYEKKNKSEIKINKTEELFN